MRSLVVYLLAMTLGCSYGLSVMELMYRWKVVDYLFPDKATRNNYTRTGAYIPGNTVILDVDVDPVGRRVFLSLPKFNNGTPATLAVVTDRSAADGSQLVRPYPDWSWHRYGDCNGITSVFRVQIDKCGRLWVIDSGVVEVLSTFQQLCPPQLLVFDLATNRLIRRHRFPNNTRVPDTLLITVVVEVTPGRCQDAYAYVADVSGFAVLVYSLYQDRSWRVSGSVFEPDPLASHFNIAGSEFDLMDGVLGLALSSPSQGPVELYFHSLASRSEFKVCTSVLKNEANFPGGQNLVRDRFLRSEGNRSSQSAAEAMDEYGTLFFSLLSYNSINCWNSRHPYNMNNIVQVERDDTVLQFLSGMKVIRETQNQEDLWAISSRFQKITTTGLNPNEYNFHVVRGPVNTLIQGTSCW